MPRDGHAKSKSRMKSHISVFLKGFLMGIAEILPGISGGTVAYITGIYVRLVDSIASCVPQKLSRTEVLDVWLGIRGALPFLLPLGIGMLLGVALMIFLINRLLDDYAVEVLALIFGLMAGAVVQMARDSSVRYLLTYGVVGLLFALGIFWLNIGHSEQSTPSYWLIFVGGFFAFTAWILPGVSGSLMLLILGIWVVMINAFAEFQIDLISSFILGMIVSILLVPKYLKRWLKSHRHQIVAVFCGLLLGSLLQVWPWQQESNQIFLPNYDSDVWQNIRVITLMAGSFLVMMTVLFYERQRKIT